jgi:acetylornithine deacetylase/succinyl-diaminopimelate desuccinylase-like protein
MVCDRCDIGGYLELLPTDDVSIWKDRFVREITDEFAPHPENGAVIYPSFTEEYVGHRLSPDDPLCLAAEVAAGKSDWSAFNSGCEAGLRAAMLNTPTLVWGPGSLAQAHAVNEFVDFSEVRTVAEKFVRFVSHWCR